MPNLKSALAVAATAGAVVLTVTAAHTLDRDTASAALGSAGRAVATTQGAGTTANDPHPDAPAIDWENILTAGVETSVSAAHDRGQLAFVPIPPRFSVQPDKVTVSDPKQVPAGDRSVAYLLHFPTSPTFPANRTTVVVIESPTQISAADLTTGAQANAARFGADAFQLVHFGAIPAELISAHGVGRIHTIVGRVAIDITGPAVSPAAVQELGTQLTAELG